MVPGSRANLISGHTQHGGRQQKDGGLTFQADALEPPLRRLPLLLHGLEAELPLLVDVVDDGRLAVVEHLEVLVRQAADQMFVFLAAAAIPFVMVW